MTHKIHELNRSIPTVIGRAFRLLFLLAFIAAPMALKAQSGGQGAITGTVADSTGAAIPDATVAATNNATGGFAG